MKRPSLGMAPIKTEVSVEAYAEIMRLEKTIERLREALRKCLPIMRKAHDRIHCLPRTSDTDLAEAIDIALGVARAALGEKE